MRFTNMRKILPPEEVIDRIPLSPADKKIKHERDLLIKDIIEHKSKKFLIIVGPCSADAEGAICEYVSRLAKIQDDLKEKLLLIPRIYTNKPRTTGEGYKGISHQPNPDKKPNMAEGILSMRSMHVRSIRESGLTAADEMLYPEDLPYCDDLLSYVSVGARSVENQQHRFTASGLNVPVGMKNPTNGYLTVMYNAIFAAQHNHSFIYRDFEVSTEGNPLAHAIIRGYVNKHGDDRPNYHYEDLLFAAEVYEDRKLKNPMIIVDTNHSNSNKNFFEQIRIAKEVLDSRKYNKTINNIVRGLMIESYLEEGNQPVGSHIYGKSITDPCLGWDDTARLLYYIAENV